MFSLVIVILSVITRNSYSYFVFNKNIPTISCKISTKCKRFSSINLYGSNILKDFENELINVFDSSRPSVVFISTLSTVFNPFMMNVLEIPSQTGSGFVWDTIGHIVTNFHVLGISTEKALFNTENFGEYMVSFVNENGVKEGIKAIVKGIDIDKDIAVLKLSNLPRSQQLKCIGLGNSEALRVGQLALAIGNPFGLDQTLTSGVVSGLGRQVIAPNRKTIYNMIQTDAAINPGNSGGPLLDCSGKLIGMNTAIYSTSGQSSGVGFAVPVDTIKVVVDRIIQNNKFERPWTGLQYVGGTEAKALFGVTRGLVITAVTPGSGAERAGFRAVQRSFFTTFTLGDVIIECNRKQVNSEADLLQSIDLKKPGDIIDVRIIRHSTSSSTGGGIGSIKPSSQVKELLLKLQLK